MKFGIHSLLFNETFMEKDLPVLDKCKSMGFDAVEIIPFDVDQFPAAKVKEAAANLDLTINLGFGMPEEYNIISEDASIRRAGIDFGKRLVDISNEAGAEILTGMIYCGWGYLSGKMRTDEEWNWAVEGFREVAQHAKDTSGLLLGIEPVNRFESHMINVARDAVKLIKDIDVDTLRVHLDSFHMIREENSISEAVEDSKDYLAYVHACENQRGIPGSGLFPWKAFFTALNKAGFDGTMTIESFDPNMDNIAKLCCIWRKLAESPEELASEGLKFLKSVYDEVYV